MNIIVVEDHDALRDVTVSALSDYGHHVVGLASAEELSELKVINRVDIMLIDINLPGESGFDLIQRIRGVYRDVGIIIISANATVEYKKQGYDIGADIYLTKPASLEEIQAAVLALSRRLTGVANNLYELTLQVQSLCLQSADHAVQLNYAEVLLLLALLRSPDQKLETWQILDVVSDDGLEYSKASLEVMIVRLRKKIVSIGRAPNPIRSIRNYGYQLCERITIAH